MPRCLKPSMYNCCCLYKLRLMFGLFKKKSEKEKLEDRYDALIKKSYELSHTNRAESDKVAAEAAALLKKIEEL